MSLLMTEASKTSLSSYLQLMLLTSEAWIFILSIARHCSSTFFLYSLTFLAIQQVSLIAIDNFVFPFSTYNSHGELRSTSPIQPSCSNTISNIFNLTFLMNNWSYSTETTALRSLWLTVQNIPSSLTFVIFKFTLQQLPVIWNSECFRIWSFHPHFYHLNDTNIHHGTSWKHTWNFPILTNVRNFIWNLM